MGAFGSVFRGFGFLAATPRTWPFALVPGVILTIFLALFGVIAVWLVQPWIDGLWGTPGAWYEEWARVATAWLGAAAAFVLGFVVALAVTPPLSGPALEKIIEAREDDLGIPRRTPLGFFQEMWCGLRAQLFAAMFVVPVVVMLWIVELLVPPAAVITVPLKICVAAVGLAWNLWDYPLTLRGTRMRDRFRFFLENKREVIGFGLAFAALFWIPCFNVLMLPVGTVAATTLLHRILAARPELLPELPRRLASAEGDPDLAAQGEIALTGREQQ